MAEAYFSREDARMCLHGTICRYDGLPCLVNVSNGMAEHEVNIVYLDPSKNPRGMKGTVVNYTSDSFDYSSPPLGYVQIMGDASHLARIPVRRNRQGLAGECVCATGLDGRSRAVDLLSMGESLHNCIMGIYPTFKEALKKLKSISVRSVAVDRHFAVSKTDGYIMLWHRNDPIGKYNETTGLFELTNDDASSFLRRAIEKVVPLC